METLLLNSKQLLRTHPTPSPPPHPHEILEKETHKRQFFLIKYIPGSVRIPVVQHHMPQVEHHSGAELCTFVVTVPVSNVFAFTVRTHIHH